ncbi:MAG TPA: tetratricopeptide repeat protein [Polyangia bacterium]|nr:tetratricopeptide repeat protein [Polyangia bacterium]
MAGEDIERLRQAALRDPAQVVKLADALVANDRAEEAVQACRTWLGKRPDDVPLRLALGRALSAAGHLEEAQAALLEAVSRQQKARGPAPPSRGPAPPPQPTPLSRLQPMDDTSPALPSFSDGESTEERATQTREPVAPRKATKPYPPSRYEEFSPTPVPPPEPFGRTPEPQRHPDPMEVEPIRVPEPPRRPMPRAAEPHPQYAHTHHPQTEAAPPENVDLDAIADKLFGGGDESEEARWQTELVAAGPEPDPIDAAWDLRRARAFVWLWVSLALITIGIGAGWIWRAKERVKLLAATVERADARTLEATNEADLAARDGYASALRVEPHMRRYDAMVALADARLCADQGEDTDAAAWAMLKRGEREQKRNPTEDPRADREMRQARALMALERGESCTETNPAEDGDIAARCALQKGDVDGARKILSQTVSVNGEGKSVRSLLAQGSLELGAGDLDAAQAAYGKVLALYPQHPRALVGRMLVALEHNETPAVEMPKGRLGPTTEGWFHLAAGLSAMGRGAPDAQASYELDQARKNIVHDGRLALLYGRARLQQGKVGEAEEAMRVAERLDPNDGDVAVLDAEVALAKGYEDKVALALAARPPTPRSLAVLGRAQVLTQKYREGAATLDAALARRPGDAVAITYRAIARAHLGDSSGAIKELEKAASTLSSTAPRYGLGLLAYERHDLLRAQRELGKALEHNSESFRARALLGRVLRDLGKEKEALAELDAVIREAPALMSARAARARLYLDLGRAREARTDAREVLDAGRASPEDKLTFAEATARLGHVDEADKALKDATDAGIPAARAAHIKLIVDSWRNPKDAMAAAHAMEKERKGAAVHDARLAIDTADAYRRAGDPRKAGDLLRAALFGDPLHANLGLGRVQMATNAYADAEASFRAALAAWEKGAFAVDDQTDARIGLARSLVIRDPKNKEALAVLESAVRDDSGSAEAQYWLAKVAHEQGDQDKARTHADKAIELDDAYGEALVLDGDLWRASNKDKAKKAYKKYLEVTPSGAEVKAVKRALGQLK